MAKTKIFEKITSELTRDLKKISVNVDDPAKLLNEGLSNFDKEFHFLDSFQNADVKNIFIDAINKLRFELLPPDLKQIPCWLNFGVDGLEFKTPVNPKSLKPANSLESCSDFKTASDNVFNRKAFGCGFFFSDCHRFIGIDFDHVLNQDGTFSNAVAKSFFESLPKTYTERSKSGDGLHCIIEVDSKKHLKGGSKKFSCNIGKTKDGKAVKIEFFIFAQYIALTGNVVDDDHLSTAKISFDSLMELAPKTSANKSQKKNYYEEVEKKIASDPVFERCWNGDSSDFISPSEADLSLFDKLLFICKGNKMQAESILEMSPAFKKISRKDDERYYIDTTFKKAEQLFLQSSALQKDNSSIDLDLDLKDFDGTENSIVELYLQKRKFLYSYDEDRILRWNGTFFEEIKPIQIHGDLIDFGKHLKMLSQNPMISSFNQKLLQKAGISLQSSKKRKWFIEGLTGVSNIQVKQSDLNRNPNILVCKNGYLDLTTTQIHEADPFEKCSQCCNVEFNPDADSSIFENIIKEAFPNINEREEFLKLLAYSMQGQNSNQIFAWIQGNAGVGKSLIFNSLVDLLGSYAMSIPFEVLRSGSRVDDGEKAKVALKQFLANQTRLVTINEANSKLLGASLLKQITGQDKITLRGNYEKKVTTYVSNATPIFISNSLPEFGEVDDPALIRRAIIIRMLGKPKTINTNLANILREKEVAEGQFAFIAKYFKLFLQEGFSTTDAMKEWKKAVFEDNNYVKEFITKRCVFSQNAEMDFREFRNMLKTEYPDESKFETQNSLRLKLERIKDSQDIRIEVKSHGGYLKIKCLSWK